MTQVPGVPLGQQESDIVAVVADFVDTRVRSVAHELEISDTYPEQLIEQMKQLGVFGLRVPEPYGGVPVSTRCFAAVTEELARGWMSLAGAMGSHSVVADLITRFGSEEQRARYLPRMATGELRAAMALTEPGGGSDLQALTTRAERDGADYVITGNKTWVTNARRAGVIALLARTDPDAQPRHRGISVLLVEAGAGYVVSPDLGKLGYRGVESCAMSFDRVRVPTTAVLGGAAGSGFAQMMSGLEVGRIQVAARAVGVARAAFTDALAYAQQRESFGKPIWQHQSVGNLLADMGTRLSASRLLVRQAADALDAGGRADLEAGMAKLFASEACMQITLDAMRIHGSYGYSTELDVERYFRDAPLMIVGEGTNEIQRTVIARQLVHRGAEPR